MAGFIDQMFIGLILIAVGMEIDTDAALMAIGTIVVIEKYSLAALS